MANTIKQKRGTSDPGASDLVVGELAINTTDGGVFTKTDGGTVVEVGGSGGASAIDDLSDAVTYDSGLSIGLGTGALASDDGTDNNNTAVGYQSLNATTSGAGNVGVGYQALKANTTGIANVAVGNQALTANTTGNRNVALGDGALAACTTGGLNFAVGEAAGQSLTTGTGNFFMGRLAGRNITASSNNVCIGSQAGDGISGSFSNYNVAIGSDALSASLTTSNSTAVGGSALVNSTGEKNTGIGQNAGNTTTSGENVTCIGYDAEASSATASNEITFGDANVTSLRIPGLQSGASDGQVLTYSSSNGNITLADAGGGGASAINDLSDAVTKDSGVTIGLGTGALANDDDSDNNNTALGYNALNANTSGAGGVAVGYEAGSATTTNGKGTFVGFECGQNVTGNHVVAVGYQALKGATGTNTAFNNTAIGYQAGTAVTSSGARNSFLGYACGKSLTSGVGNVVLGSRSGVSLTTGSNNVVIGYEACGDGSGQLTTGSNNIVIGKHAKSSSATSSNEITLGNTDITSLRIPGLQSGASDGQVLTFNSTNGNITLADAGGGLLTEDTNKNISGGTNSFASPITSGSDKADNNVAIGEQCLQDISSGDLNVAIGKQACKDLTSGGANVGIGEMACGGNSAGMTGIYNVAIGKGPLDSVTTGRSNVALGRETLEKCTTGSYNIALGEYCLKDTTTGEYNIAMGEGSQRYATGSNNISMGYRTGHNISGSNNVLLGPSILTSSSDSLSGSNNTLIGKSASPSSASVNNEMTLGNSSLNTLRCNQTSITSLSDGRDKINVAELGEGLDFVTRLKPVKFEWKTRDGNSKDGTYEAGFIAQDLQQLQKDTDTDYLKLVMDSNPDRLEASYGKLVPILVRAIQELKSEVEQLKANV